MTARMLGHRDLPLKNSDAPEILAVDGDSISSVVFPTRLSDEFDNALSVEFNTGFSDRFKSSLSLLPIDNCGFVD
jgi:hypothetical protein